MESGKLSIEMGNLYYALRNNSALKPYIAYCELIDNAIDNNATEIRFSEDAESITISDNGDGIASTPEDMSRVLRMYKSSNEGDKNKTGEYGVGLKEASMRLGRSMRIVSRKEGYDPVQIDVHWKSIKDYSEGATYKVLNKDMPIGTSVTMYYDEELEKPYKPAGKTFRYYHKMIQVDLLKIYGIDGQLYTPDFAIGFGHPFERVDLSINGKKYHVCIGLLAKDQVRKSGFYVYSDETLRYFTYSETYLVENRKEFAARDGLYVSIGLKNTKHDWKLDKNKREVTNINEILDDPIFYNLYQKWRAKLYNDIKTDVLNKMSCEIAKIMGFEAPDIAIGEERRERKNGGTGKVEPTGTGGRRKKSTEIRRHPEKRVEKKNGLGKGPNIEIVIVNLPNDAAKQITIDKDENVIKVRLNKANGFINETLNNMSEYKDKTLQMAILWALSAWQINPAEIKYTIADEIFRDRTQQNQSITLLESLHHQ